MSSCLGDAILEEVVKIVNAVVIPTELISALFNDCIAELMDYEMKHRKLKMSTVAVWQEYARKWRDSMPDLKVSQSMPVYAGSYAEGMSNSEDIDIMFVAKWVKMYPETEPFENNPNMLPYTWDCVYPGYIRIIVPSVARQAYNYLEYQIKRQGRHFYLTSDGFIQTMKEWGLTGSGLNSQGPALKGKGVDDSSYDIVHAVQLTSWPPFALDFFNRQNNRSHKDKETIRNLNVYAVATGYRLSKDSNLEWRLSFTEAEKLITSSWTGIQSQCYYLLKHYYYIYLKHPETLCSYFLKTLIFWMEDILPDDYWTEQMNLSDSFVKALTLLLHFMETRNLPNYFIPQNNMISHKNKQEIETICGVIKWSLNSKQMNILMAELLCEENIDEVLRLSKVHLSNFPVRSCRQFCHALRQYHKVVDDPENSLIHNEAELLSSLGIIMAIWYIEQCLSMEEVLLSLHQFVPEDITPAFETLIKRLIADFYHSQKTRVSKQKAIDIYLAVMTLKYPSGFDDKQISGTVHVAFYYYLEGSYEKSLLYLGTFDPTSLNIDHYMDISLPVWQSNRFFNDKLLYDLVSKLKPEFPLVINIVILGLYIQIRSTKEVTTDLEKARNDVMKLMKVMISLGEASESSVCARSFFTVFRQLRQYLIANMNFNKTEIPNARFKKVYTRNQRLKLYWQS